jgi:proteasome lid subunit RPN8/RPN11
MITTLLEEKIVQEIAALGRERAPAEACGILLPTPHKGERVWEMPNRSLHPQDSFTMHGTDIKLSVGDWEGDFREMVIWHTHPAGNIGPSREDLRGRLDRVGNLVITLLPNNEAKATWY